MNTVKPTLTAVCIGLALSACSLAPRYRQPDVALPSSVFKYDMQDTQTVQAASVGWQDYFADPRLHRLIELALHNNTDMRTANLNVEQVRAQYAISRSARLPNVSANGQAKRGQSSGSDTIGESYSVGLGVTSFELDLWGRVRNTSIAALQRYFSTAAGRDSTQLSLIAAVAKAHFNEIAATENMQLSKRVLDTRMETYRLSKLRHEAGVISALALNQQEALIANAKSSYAAAVKNRELARNNLQLLISQALPEDLPPALPLSQQYTIRNLPAGLPSEVLLNRPDIRAAEHDLRQQNANIGAARAQFFPTISLTGSIGHAHTQLSKLFDTGTKNWGVGGGIHLPIFDWGSNWANLKATKVARDKAIVAYEAAVENAFRDVSDALVARAAFNSQFDADKAQSKAYSEVLRLTRLRYRHGVSGSLELLDAERNSYNANAALIATELKLMENLADLYKALGGGLKRYTQDDVQVRKQIAEIQKTSASSDSPSAAEAVNEENTQNIESIEQSPAAQ